MVSGPTIPYDSTVRATFGDEQITIKGWPSRGGVISLDEAEAIDFEFLGLDPLDPPANRDSNQDAEDVFCQRLLLLGAKWWDSEGREFAVGCMKARAEGYAEESTRHSDGSFRNSTPLAPTMREKRWVKVGWPSTGGVWVSEFELTWDGVEDEKDLPPYEGLAKVKMARTMDEWCQILRDTFRGEFYQRPEEYEGYAFLRAWEWKKSGEVGRLLTPEETIDQWRASFASIDLFGKRRSRPCQLERLLHLRYEYAGVNDHLLTTVHLKTGITLHESAKVINPYFILAHVQTTGWRDIPCLTKMNGRFPERFITLSALCIPPESREK